VTQSVSAVQPPLQAVAEAQTCALGQGALVVGVTQVPAPLQVGAAVIVEPEQEGMPQVVPLAPKRQAPAPSQVPSRPQVVPAAVQRPFDPPPATMFRQRPLFCPVSAEEHDWQRPPQAFSQQTLPTQALFVHWLPAEQVVPLACFAVQVPLAQ
jgi:hypothetical protein